MAKIRENFRVGPVDPHCAKICTRWSFACRSTFTREEAEAFAIARTAEEPEEFIGIVSLSYPDGAGDDADAIEGPLAVLFLAGLRFTPDARPFVRCTKCGRDGESSAMTRRYGLYLCGPCDRDLFAPDAPRCSEVVGGLTCSRVAEHQGEHVFDDVPAPAVKP